MRTRLTTIVLALLAAPAPAQEPTAAERPRIPEPERFVLDGRPAFLLLPDRDPKAAATPWVWYAPTLKQYPGDAERWMFARLLAAGVAVAGIDVGESYGSPTGTAQFEALRRHLMHERGMAPRPCLLARSRGGLMLYSWAVEHPDAVAGVAGIYPVCDLTSYPGLEKASAAFGMSEAELRDALSEHNPVDRLAPLAAARVPLFHVHGDQDRVVPLEDNSGRLRDRYRALGGDVTLVVAEGHGHDMWRGFFESEALADFAVARARTTGGLLDPAQAKAPAGAVWWIGPDGSRMVPEKPDEPSRWKFADGVLTASPAWDSVVTAEAYGDFRMHVEFAVNEVADGKREARGNSGVYIQQRYEVQILDSFGVSADDYTASDCGSLYRLRKPDRPACRPSGEWQAFDIAFRAARFRGDEKVADARITVLQNGVRLHDDVAIPRKTGAGQQEGPDARPIKLQGHHNEVRFRNFWVQRL